MAHRTPIRRRRPRTLPALMLVLFLALTLAACGGGEDGGAVDARRTTELPGPPGDPSQPVEPGSEAVVRRWAATLRRGDVAGAAELFALPAVVSNGTRPVTLDTREQLRLFNRSLPCGAELLASEPGAHGFLVVTFRLTERRGAGECGSGTGSTARTALRVTDGRIDYWLRLGDRPPAPAPNEPAPDAPAPSSPDESTA